MKKALIVVNLAGFLNFLWNDIATLQSMQYEVSIAMNGKLMDGSDAVEIQMLNQMKLNHYQVDFDTKSPLTKKNLLAYKQLRQILKEGYDLIHCHTPIAGMLTRVAADKYRRKGAKVIYTTHGFTFTDKSPKKDWVLYYTVEAIMSHFCDAIITINHEDFRNAQKMHCKNVFIIPSVGLDNSRFNNIQINRDAYRQELGVGEEDIMVLAVGELSVRKNQQVIIKAIHGLPDKERYVLVICGHAIVESTMEQDLRQLAKKLNVRIRLMGHRHDIPELNMCADVAVISSLREGFGMTGVEAMAAGTPVVGSDVQGIREYVVPGKTGYLCNPTDEMAFAKAIDKIVCMNKVEREIFRNECKKMALNFDVSKSKVEMSKIYRYLLESDKPYE